jgi:hypothetical protein
MMVLDTPGNTLLASDTLTGQAFVFLVFDVTDKNSINNLGDYIDNF